MFPLGEQPLGLESMPHDRNMFYFKEIILIRGIRKHGRPGGVDKVVITPPKKFLKKCYPPQIRKAWGRPCLYDLKITPSPPSPNKNARTSLLLGWKIGFNESTSSSTQYKYTFFSYYKNTKISCLLEILSGQEYSASRKLTALKSLQEKDIKIYNSYLSHGIEGSFPWILKLQD